MKISNPYNSIHNPDFPKVSTPKPQAVRPRKNAAQEWAQGAVEKLNRMRTDEAYRQEIAAKTK